MKKIPTIVISAHFFLILWMALWLPSKRMEKKPLVIKTSVYTPPPPPTPAPAKPTPQKVAAQPKPKPKPKPKPSPKPKPKKVAAKPKPKAKPQPKISPALARQLQESLQKLDTPTENRAKTKTIDTPKRVANLQIDHIESEDAGKYVGTLVDCLQSALHLPDMGAVKLELTLTRDGKCIRVHVVSSKSERNKAFLESELKNVAFPPFTGPLKQEKEHLFVITFCNR